MSAATMTRRERRKAKRAAREANAARVMPPEGVPLQLAIASVGVRMGAQIVDILITFAAAIAILVLLGMAGLLGITSFQGLAALLFFAIRVPYYVLAELVWNGQTLGKKFMKIKVVSHDGGPLTAHALVLRNLMKEAEIFLPGTLLLTVQVVDPVSAWISTAWVAMAFAIPLSNAYRQRLGDMLAGTHVVHLPVPILLKDLARESPRAGPAKKPAFAFLAHQLDHYGAYELQTLETVLRAQDQRMDQGHYKRNQATVVSIVDKIRRKIGYADVVKPDEAVTFLRTFYNAQRAHLEQRQIFGDRRRDKFHDAQKDEA
ncbi:MAG: RDD family protein [Pseudomonadota bacterium]